MDIRPQSRGGRGTVQLVELLDFAIEQTNDGIAIMRFTDDAGVPMRIVYANGAIERLSGFTRQELLDPSNPLLRVQTENRPRYDEYLQEVRDGNPVHFQIEFHGKSESRWCDILWSPLRYKNGEVTHYVAVLRDISERRIAKAERDRLHRAIEQAHDGLCIVDIPDGDVQGRRITYVNDALCKLLKMPRGQILGFGRGISDLLFADEPNLIEQYVSDVASGRTFVRDVRVRCGDGSMRWLHMTASPVYSESGKIEDVTVTFEDVEDLKYREDQVALFESILSQTSDFVVTADTRPAAEGGPRITFVNPAFAAIAGMESRDIIGCQLFDFLSPNNEPAVIANVAERLERHQNISVELLVRRRGSGAELWIELSGHQVRGENARTASWLFIGKDVSARKQGYVQTAQLVTALDLAEEPINIYRVGGVMHVEPEYANESADVLGTHLLEEMLADSFQRDRIRSAWPLLEDSRSVKRLIRAGKDPGRHWLTLELRPMVSHGKLSSLITIEWPLRPASYKGQPDEVETMLALSREILGFDDFAERRDAFSEVLREEIGATATFSRTSRASDVVLRVKDNNGYVIMPPAVFFQSAVAVDLTWFGAIPPRRLTAFRIFLETLARSD